MNPIVSLMNSLTNQTANNVLNNYDVSGLENSSPQSYGRSLLEKFPGFKNSPTFQNGYAVYDATPERQNTQYGQQRYSEWFDPKNKGGSDQLNNPAGNVNYPVDEIYKKDYINNPGLKQELSVGEMLHGMHNDSYYSQLRNNFSNSFTPEAQRRNNFIYNNWKNPNENFSQTMNRTILDSYLRAG
jgi:hypothetical protein